MSDSVTPELSQNARMGRPPLAEPFVNLNMKVPPEIRAKLDAYAAEHGVALVDVVSRAIEAYTARKRKAIVPWPRIVDRRKTG